MLNLTRSAPTILLLVVLALVAALWFSGLNTRTPSPPARPTIHQLRQLADLLTLRVPVSDVQVSRITGYVGGIELALIVHGHAHLGTDLGQARFTDVNHNAQRTVLKLPEPDVRHASLDHSSTRVYRIDRRGLWQLVPGDAGEAELFNRAMERAEAVVATHAVGAGSHVREEARNSGGREVQSSAPRRCVRSERGRPLSVPRMLNSSVAGGVNRTIRSSRSRNNVAISVAASRLFRSEESWLSSSTRWLARQL